MLVVPFNGLLLSVEIHGFLLRCIDGEQICRQSNQPQGERGG